MLYGAFAFVFRAFTIRVQSDLGPVNVVECIMYEKYYTGASDAFSKLYALYHGLFENKMLFLFIISQHWFAIFFFLIFKHLLSP